MEAQRIPVELLLQILDLLDESTEKSECERLRKCFSVTPEVIKAALRFKHENFLVVYSRVQYHEITNRAQDGMLTGLFEFLKWLATQRTECPEGYTEGEYEMNLWVRVRSRKKDRVRRCRRACDTAALSIDTGIVLPSASHAFRNSPLWEEFVRWVRWRAPTVHRNKVLRHTLDKIAADEGITVYAVRQRISYEMDLLKTHCAEFVEICLAKGYDFEGFGV